MPSSLLTRRNLLAAAGPLLALPGALVAGAGRAFGQDMPGVDEVLHDPEVPVLGNPEGDVTIVEFFDYQCPYCKRGHADVMRVVEEDGQIRLVMKDWPILGEPSRRASRLALAAVGEGGHEAALHALMKTDGRLSDAAIDAALREAGLDPLALEAGYAARAESIDAILARNAEQARGFKLRGVPAFVIGTFLVPGLIAGNVLEDVVERARRS
ncbi:DsbA family protein [Geminicoccaceae bacterium 1502E]|nr:DsbA family protein [Geminicoccaceae bacterium 1502E]